MHFLHAQARRVKVGLDIGFTNAGVSRFLRQTGGYWMSVELTPQSRDLVAAALDGDTVLCSGEGGELPFEDKQFDVVVMALGVLPGSAEAGPMVKECHRVLKAGGHFILTVEYRKRFGLAAALSRQHTVSGVPASYNEADIFLLLKDGFDVVGFRYTCRFWVQLVRQWAGGRRASQGNGAAAVWLRCLYGLARALDAPLVLTRGYQMTICGRRKGWREKQSGVLANRTLVSDALLSNPRRDGRHASLARFK